MAITSGFFNSVNGDRKYNAEQMSMFFDKLISSGVYPNPSTNLQVVAASGMSVNVLAGRGMIDCRWINNDATELLTLEQSDSLLDRVDAVVMVLDLNDSVRDCHLAIKKGTPASTPVAPEMERSAYVKEYCLATVYVRALESEITQNNITDTRANTNVCGWVTSLIDQVDTATLFLQWQDAYQKFYDDSDAEFDEWFTRVKDTLATATLLQTFEAYHTTTVADQLVIPIEIDRYIRQVDILQVFINGMKLSPVLDYDITGDFEITLTKPVDIGTIVQFAVYKSIDGSDAASALELVEDLADEVDRQRNLINKDVSISTLGWSQDGDYYSIRISDDNVTENDVVNVNFKLQSMSVVSDAEVLGLTESYNGYFKIFAVNKPTTYIYFDYIVIKGKVVS